MKLCDFLTPGQIGFLKPTLPLLNTCRLGTENTGQSETTYIPSCQRSWVDLAGKMPEYPKRGAGEYPYSRPWRL